MKNAALQTQHFICNFDAEVLKMDTEKLIRKAQTLIQALPYMQQFHGKTIVIKYGGNAMINEEIKNSVMEDITLLKFIGLKPVVVHGGGPDISSELKAHGVESKFINGLRVTDEQTVNIARMVLVGKTNKEIVAGLNQKGGKAVGICGIDGGLLQCKKLYADVDGKKTDIGYVGNVIKVNPDLINLITSDEYIPVIAPIGTDENGQSYNVNADTVAGVIASALNAEKLMLLTDINGVHDKEDNVIAEMSCEDIDSYIKDGTISGGMIPKVLGCKEAIDAGVERVHIVDGRVPHCILLEIFTNDGIGTMITK